MIARHDIIVLGAGASGLMATVRFKNRDIAIIEANHSIGAKIKISGGGKCNITNEVVSENNYWGDQNFIKPILENFDQKDLFEFLKLRGLSPVIRKNRQYFCPNSSMELISIFQKEVEDIPIYFGENIVQIERKDTFLIHTKNHVFSANSLIVATGGLSYRSIGASDIAYNIAKSFGHNIKTLKPSLVGFTLQKDQFWFKGLSGISVEVAIKVGEKYFQDDLLFAHKGISGPVVLNSSLYWDKGEIEIDFIPKHNLQKLLKKNSRKKLSSILPLPKRFSKSFLNSINIEDKAVEDLSKDELDRLNILKNYSFSPAGNFGYTKAEVTKGGVDTSEICALTMMSKKVDGLYFIGECLDVTGELGGYNFQWAFSSAQRLSIA